MKTAALALVLGVPILSCSRAPGAAPPAKADADVVAMEVDAQKNVGVAVAPAGVVELTEYLHAAGTVQPIEARIGLVRSLARGRVLEVLARAGDRVEAGQPLARVDNIEAGELAAQYLAAQAERQKLRVQQAAAARQLERSQNLVAIGAVSRKELELAQAEHQAVAEAINAQDHLLAGLGAKLRRLGLAEPGAGASSVTTLVAPFAGVVLRVQTAPGDVVDPEDGLFSIADLSEVWVQAEVYEKDLGRVRTGQTALVTVDTYPGETFSGRVVSISDALDPATRAAPVRCVVPNRDRRLKLDMLVGVEVPASLSRKALAVPAAAVQEIAGRTVVFVRLSDRTFRVREVRVGQTAGGLAEIVSGLAEHEPVVVQGAYHLKAVRLNKELGEG